MIRGVYLLANAAVLMFFIGVLFPPWEVTDVDQWLAERPDCDKAYSGDVHAIRACLAAFTLQYNWYPSPIAGLFSYPVWNGFDGFWQDGAALETLANLMAYGKNTMYKSVLKASIRDLYSLLVAYGPQPSYDDMGWYAISYLRIHEVLGPEDDTSKYGFLGETRQIYDWIWQNGWDQDGTCEGGFWFDQTLASKQTVENAQMLFLAAKLHRITKDPDLVNHTEMIWNFIEKNKLIDENTFLVSDGIDLVACGSNRVFGPSYNMGLMMSALVEAGPVLNRTDEFVNLAIKIAYATIQNMTTNRTMVEYCSPNCDDDAKLFKGIFMRNLRYLVDYMEKYPTPKNKLWRDKYMSYMRNNSDIVWQYNRCEPSTQKCLVLYKDGPPLNNVTVGPVFGKDYRGPYNSSCPITQTAVLDLFVSGINPRTTCKIPTTCAFDPPPPTPTPLTCKDNPCPPDQPCCAYDSYYTCCESTQKCVNGYCE